MVDLFVQWNLNSGLMMNTRRSNLERQKELVSSVSSNWDLEDVDIIEAANYSRSSDYKSRMQTRGI
jgi:diketogulonate reductase-like aldo/keto reductase